MWENPKTILRKCKSFTLQLRMTRFCSMAAWTTLQTSTGTENREDKEEGNTHGFLRKYQPPACSHPVATKDRSGRTQCQAEKTGIVEQVTRWQDSKTGQTGDHPHSGESQCVAEQRTSFSSYRLANVTTLPTANVEVTHTRWRWTTRNCRRHREGDCDAEQLVST